MLKILMVDNSSEAEEEVREGLRRIGAPCKIEFYCPKYREKTLGGCNVPVGKGFDEFDLALIDLELFIDPETT